MKGTVVDIVGYPPDMGGGVGYIIKTDKDILELWPEESLELEGKPPPMPDDEEEDEDEE